MRKTLIAVLLAFAATPALASWEDSFAYANGAEEIPGGQPILVNIPIREAPALIEAIKADLQAGKGVEVSIDGDYLSVSSKGEQVNIFDMRNTGSILTVKLGHEDGLRLVGILSKDAEVTQEGENLGFKLVNHHKRSSAHPAQIFNKLGLVKMKEYQ